MGAEGFSCPADARPAELCHSQCVWPGRRTRLASVPVLFEERPQDGLDIALIRLLCPHKNVTAGISCVRVDV